MYIRPEQGRDVQKAETRGNLKVTPSSGRRPDKSNITYMKEKHVCPLLLGLLLSLACGAFAQSKAVSIPYAMGFEESDSLELKNWVLNPGANAPLCAEKWVTGEGAKSEGKRAMYISNDGGTSPTFGTNNNVQYAYRDIIVPKGVYDVSFDWCCIGSKDAVMYAGIGPMGNLNMAADNTSSIVPKNVQTWCKSGNLRGSSSWKNASLKLTSNGNSTYRIFFVWASSNKDTTIAYPLAGCIDNVQICSANCIRPTNVTAELLCDTIILHWEGSSEKYSLQYRRRGSTQWSIPRETSNESYVLGDMEEGMYDFRVRGICNGDTSAYAYAYLTYALFCPEKHCINYVDLHAPDVTCTYGDFNNPYEHVGVLDEGFGGQEMYYRHVVNWDKDRVDPMTDNKLPLVPKDELASVRLGNWHIDGKNNRHAQSVSYKYTADIDNAAILFLKYAVVYEAPGHSKDENPRFTLEVLGADGNAINSYCGGVDVTADAKMEESNGWHKYDRGKGQPLILWKEWTTVGINLAEVGVKTGDELTIRLTTKDCALGAHFGYAYFTLGCAAAKLYGTGCAGEAKMSIEAPDGFRYEWYDNQGTLVGTGKTYDIAPSDTSTYSCRLVSLEKELCYFHLQTSLRPRFPVAEFKAEYIPSDCENRVRFTNKSHVMTIYGGDTTHNYNELCEGFSWDFGELGVEGTAYNPEMVFPQKGGLYPVKLYADISDGACVDSMVSYVFVPKIGDSVVTIDSTICEGNAITGFGRYNVIASSGVYYDSLKSVAGCDSIAILNLTVNPVSKTYLPDTTVCAEVPLCIGGDCFPYTRSEMWVRYFENQYGCDSTVWMNVIMKDSILPTVSIQEPADKQGTGSITISGKGYDYFYMNGERYDATNTYFTGYDGGIFEFEFFNDFGCSVLYTDTMNSECLQVRLGETGLTCMGATEFMIPFVVDSGIPTTYTLLFDSVAHAAGFQDVVAQPYSNRDTLLTIPIPATATPNIYMARLEFHNILSECAEQVFEVSLPLNFPSDLIFQRWSDVLSVYGTDYNGEYTFDGFQWLKDGKDIAGATGSYYYEEGGLDTDAEYQVQVTLPDGTELLTCPFVPTEYMRPETQPKKVIENQHLMIIYNGVRYNAQGNKMTDKQ